MIKIERRKKTPVRTAVRWALRLSFVGAGLYVIWGLSMASMAPQAFDGEKSYGNNTPVVGPLVEKGEQVAEWMKNNSIITQDK